MNSILPPFIMSVLYYLSPVTNPLLQSAVITSNAYEPLQYHHALPHGPMALGNGPYTHSLSLSLSSSLSLSLYIYIYIYIHINNYRQNEHIYIYIYIL